MTYESPRDELLVGILLAVAAPNLAPIFTPVLAGAALIVGVGAYAVAAS